MTYRPISRRDAPDPDLDTLHEGVEPWLVDPLWGWLQPFLWSRGSRGTVYRNRFIQRLGMALRVRPGLDFTRDYSAARDVETRFRHGGLFAMDVIGYAVSTLAAESTDQTVTNLNEILALGGSAWEASRGTEDAWRLTRRDLRAAKDAISSVEASSQKAHDLLAAAWAEIATREPDPNGGYDKAVKAVEAAAQPVVSPGNGRATLGTIIADMKAKPTKWRFALGDLDLVIQMSERLWKTHIRHGTDARTDHTLPEADAALHLAIPLVRYFAGGLVETA